MASPLRQARQALRARAEERRLSDDLALRPGPGWERGPDAPGALYDAGSAQIGARLYVFGGYFGLDRISDRLHVFDLDANRWLENRALPPGVAQSHFAVTGDGVRFIYVVSGQLGPQCSPAVPDVFAYDTEADSWHDLPALPEPRYAGTMQYWRGRLHFVGGAREDRWTPAADHWSLGVRDGRTDETGWRPQAPIPVPGMHRGSVLHGDAFYVFGGQQGDFQAIPGDPDCRCTPWTEERYISAVFRLEEPEGDWRRLSDMPIPASHTDFSVMSSGEEILVVGGQIHKDPESFALSLTDAIQAYHPVLDRWRIAGHLPYRLKLPQAGVHGGRLFVTTGQRGRKGGGRPGPISGDSWWLPLSALAPPAPPAEPARAADGAFRGKRVLLLSHVLNHTGAPLLLLETAQLLMRAGASVTVASASDDIAGWSVASALKVPVIPLEMAGAMAGHADLVIVNTLSGQPMGWLADELARRPGMARRLVVWVHEIDVDEYLPQAGPAGRAACLLFDSVAARETWSAALEITGRTAVVRPAVSDAMRAALTAPGALFPADPLRNDPTSLAAIGRQEARRALGVGPEDMLLLSIAPVRRAKGQRLVARSLARAARRGETAARLLLVGFQSRKKRRKFLLLNALSLGRVLSPRRCYLWQREIAAFYRAADVFVMNSQGADGRSGECFGRVTIEAMAAGLPVLGTDAGGTREIVRDGETGFLYPTGEAGQAVMLDQLARLERDRDLARRMGEAGRKRVAEVFSEARFLREFEAAMTPVLNGAGLTRSLTDRVA